MGQCQSPLERCKEGRLYKVEILAGKVAPRCQWQYSGQVPGLHHLNDQGEGVARCFDGKLFPELILKLVQMRREPTVMAEGSQGKPLEYLDGYLLRKVRFQGLRNK